MNLCQLVIIIEQEQKYYIHDIVLKLKIIAKEKNLVALTLSMCVNMLRIYTHPRSNSYVIYL